MYPKILTQICEVVLYKTGILTRQDKTMADTKVQYQKQKRRKPITQDGIDAYRIPMIEATNVEYQRRKRRERSIKDRRDECRFSKTKEMTSKYRRQKGRTQNIEDRRNELKVPKTEDKSRANIQVQIPKTYERTVPKTEGTKAEYLGHKWGARSSLDRRPAQSIQGRIRTQSAQTKQTNGI